MRSHSPLAKRKPLSSGPPLPSPIFPSVSTPARLLDFFLGPDASLISPWPYLPKQQQNKDKKKKEKKRKKKKKKKNKEPPPYARLLIIATWPRRCLASSLPG
jgi:hypothetical protein